MCESDKGGKMVAYVYSERDAAKGVIFLLFQSTQLLASGCACLPTNLPTYQPRLIARLVQVSRARKGFVLPGYPFPIPDPLDREIS